MNLYSQQGNDETLEELITKNAYLVKKIVYHLLARLPKNVQGDDLMQAGMIGLLEAARNYDVTKMAKFETYASIRIRGSVLDELRKSSWIPRSAQQNMRLISQAIHTIENKTGQPAQAKDIAQELGVELADYLEMASASYATELFSLHDVAEENILTQQNDDEPFEHLQKKQLVNKLVQQLEKLPTNEQLVLSFYYSEKLNFKEISQVLGVGEARICQLHAQGIARLQARMKKEVKHDI